VLLGCTFLMGLHSTLFGPVKFAYLPQHLDERELTGGNGMVEMGTFVGHPAGPGGGRAAGGGAAGRPALASAVACIALAWSAGSWRRPFPGAGHRPRDWSSTGTPSARPGAT
jgi:hypothetical protein